MSAIQSGSSKLVTEPFRPRRYDDEEEVEDVLASDDTLVEEVPVVDYSILQAEAKAAQRLAIMRNVSDYVEGSMDAVTCSDRRKDTVEKVFRIAGLIEWNSGEPVAIVEAMRRGRLRVRVSAAMGTGKSTVLPSYIAKHMDHRVLYVGLDVSVMSAMNSYITRQGKGTMYRKWPVGPVSARVNCMTYKDYCVLSSMQNRSRMSCYQTIIFDESSAPRADVRAALKIFAVTADANVNLLLTSATLRTDGAGATGSVHQGSVKVLNESVSVEEAMASGKLLGNYLSDRMVYFVPTDTQVHDLAQYYEQHGVSARTLDSASYVEDLNSITDWLSIQDCVVRVVVAHTRFAIAANFPLEAMLAVPRVEVLQLVGESLFPVLQPMTEDQVSQMVARVGRGIVKGSSALVLGPERDEVGEISLVDKVDEFVYLRAASITPNASSYWDGVRAMFPDGLSPAVAQMIRGVNLPPVLALRYLGKDGLIASKYANAIGIMSQSNHYIYPSDSEFPIGYAGWPEEKLFGSEDAGVNVRVPLHTKGELQVLVHAIEAIAEGHIFLPKWRMKTRPEFADVERKEVVESSAVVQRRMLPRVRSFEKKEAFIAPEKSKRLGWTLEALEVNTSMGGVGTRSGQIIDKGRFEQAVNSLLNHVSDFTPSSPQLPIDSTERTCTVELPVYEVETPGGTVLCQMSSTLATALNDGVKLDVDGMIEYVQLYRAHRDRLVLSKVFDMFGRAWDSVLLAMNDDAVMHRLARRGLATYAIDSATVLNRRFALEMIHTVKTSHLTRKAYKRMFSGKVSLNKMMQAIRNGNFYGIAQSEAFLRRIDDLKYWLDGVLICAERVGLYLPSQITEQQRALPIHFNTPLGRVGPGGLREAPNIDGGWQKTIVRSARRSSDSYV